MSLLSVALTGNLGSGKSTVLRRLAERGAVVADADAMVHALLSEGGEGVAPVLARFPSAAAPGGRAVDRAALAALVFRDEAARHDLEGLLHPLVWRRQSEARERARASGARLFVVEVPLLFEAWRRGGPDPRERFDVLVAVTCDPEVAVERAARRSPLWAEHPGPAREEARRRLAAQMPQEEKARLADLVVDNSGSLDDARAAADLLVSRLEHWPPCP